MVATVYNAFNLNGIGFGEPRSNSNGGKFVPLYDGEPKNRVQFQLGELGDTVDKTTALRVAFPPEVNKFDTNKTEMTIEVGGEPLAFVRGLEGKVIEAALQNKKTWFKKGSTDEMVRNQFSSRIKSSDSVQYPSDTMKVRVFPGETEVYIVKVDSAGLIKCDGGVECTEGSLDAVNRG